MTHLLAVNAGSSSLRLALYAMGAAPQLCWQAQADGLNGPQPQLRCQLPGADASRQPLAAGGDGHARALQQALADLPASARPIDAVVHRIVHGGPRQGPERLDDGIIAALQALVPLAPLHQPVGLHLLQQCRLQLPQARQYACYDTDFHRTLPPLSYRVPLPEPWPSRGVRQYGFHGISYRHLYRCLLQQDPALVQGRVVLAHLGAGASLCAVQAGESRATTMGFSALDGLPMATRSGRLDAGILLYLLQQGLDATALERLLYHDSGLKALSGSTGDMRALLASDTDAARFAVAYFCDRVAREIAVMAAAIGGIDALVFSGGIGEHAGAVRAQVAARCSWLGLQLDAQANEAQAVRLSAAGSRVACYRLVTDEALSMAEQLQPLR